MINKQHKLSQEQQCALLEVPRSTYYYKPVVKQEASIIERIMQIYQTYPVYGYRRITACLQRDGMAINKKRVQRLMKTTGLKAISLGPVTTRYKAGDKIYPNLLKNTLINSPFQAYQTDITYIRTIYGFMYLTALIDSYSRYVVSWRLSNSLSSNSCLDALTDALSFYPLPLIVHSDRGSQFTSQEWAHTLTQHNISISMSGQGKSNQNAKIERLWRTLKYEFLYIYTFKNALDLKKMITQFVSWYNHERPHQALNYKTPAETIGIKGSNILFTKKKENCSMILV